MDLVIQDGEAVVVWQDRNMGCKYACIGAGYRRMEKTNHGSALTTEKEDGASTRMGVAGIRRDEVREVGQGDEKNATQTMTAIMG